MSETRSASTEVEKIHQGNLEALEHMLELCPKTGTKLVLIDALIRKESWGGKKNDPDNIFRMSQPADFEYYLYAMLDPLFQEACDTKGPAGNEMFKKILADFLAMPKINISGEKLVVLILKLLTRVRIQQTLDKQRDEARYRRMTKELDANYPMQNARIFKKANALFPDEKESERTWLSFFMGVSADTRTRLGLIEKEIESVLKHHPVWTKFLEKVPGIGPWFGGYLIASIGDPRKFAKTSKINGLAGVRVDDNGFAQKAKSPFFKQQNLSAEQIEAKEAELDSKKRSMSALDCDPFLKMILCEVLPGVMMKIKGAMEKKGTASESPYNALIDSIRLKERTKALNAKPEKCRYCEDTNIINLGTITEGDRTYFGGFCCSKTIGKATQHKFFNPAHIQRRVQRELGKKLFADVYHTWLFCLGEN